MSGQLQWIIITKKYKIILMSKCAIVDANDKNWQKLCIIEQDDMARFTVIKPSGNLSNKISKMTQRFKRKITRFHILF